MHYFPISQCFPADYRAGREALIAVVVISPKACGSFAAAVSLL